MFIESRVRPRCTYEKTRNIVLKLFINVTSVTARVYVLPNIWMGCHDTQNVLYKCNHPSKRIRLICMDGLTLTIFPGQAQT